MSALVQQRHGWFAGSVLCALMLLVDPGGWWVGCSLGDFAIGMLGTVLWLRREAA